MHDDPKPSPKPSMAGYQPASSTRALRRIASALGVPVSNFGGEDADARSLDGPVGSEEAAMLATIQSYLKRANPLARDRFVATAQSMVKLPSA